MIRMCFVPEGCIFLSGVNPCFRVRLQKLFLAPATGGAHSHAVGRQLHTTALAKERERVREQR